jgi:peptidoglycan/xylan/chitin deacetylase (PgdA/CDA1 family)/alpha-beta hydrolase superfamily lysophospholipase
VPESSRPNRVPLWIGGGKSALFGLLHTPGAAAGRRAAAVVVVPPLGYEAICAHRALKSLAERLAERGFFALRYDHPGAGDSAGEATDGITVTILLDGVARVIETAKRECATDRVVLVGLRAGALLALKAAEGRADVSSLVLWAPPPTGRSYVRELRALGGFGAAERSNAARVEEVAGFAYSPEMLEDLAELDAPRITPPKTATILIVPRDDVPAPPLHALGPWASAAELQAWPGYADTVRDPHDVRLPEILLDGVAEWIEKRNPRTLPGTRSVEARPRVELESRRDSNRSIVEQAVCFGPEQRLFGIVTLPDQPTASGPCVLWLNAGATHRVGMNNNYVSFARAWAERGVTSLRFDASGLGDSAALAPDRENILYSPEMVADVKSAMDFMEQACGTHRFVLAGLCAGGYAAFHTALADERVTAAMIINPQTFDWRPGDSLAIERRRAYRAANWYRRSALRLESWQKALRGEVDLLRVGKLLADRLSAYVHSRAAALRRGNSANTLAAAFDRLCSRGTQVLLVYSAEDPGLDHLRDELGSALERLEQNSCFALEVVGGADHTFSTLKNQQKLRTCLSGHLSRWHGTLAAEATPSSASAGVPQKLVAKNTCRAAKRALASLVPRSWLIVHGPRTERRIALTFDDGPTELTPAYLEVLDRYRVKGTFFLVGEACERWPGEALEIARRGHALGGHGYTHRTFPTLESRILLDELRRTHDLLPPQSPSDRWLRPPYGAVTPRSLFECARAGFSTVLWSYDSGDSRTTSTEALLGSFIAQPPRAGDIVLLHEDQPHTLKALPDLLERLLESDYELVTVPELVR